MTFMTEDIKEYAEEFEFLDELRESGDTNMLGAGPYLQREFGYGRAEAMTILKLWMASFDGGE